MHMLLQHLLEYTDYTKINIYISQTWDSVRLSRVQKFPPKVNNFEEDFH